MRRSALFLGFAIVGAVGGGAFAHTFANHTNFVALLVVTTTVCSLALARFVDRMTDASAALGAASLGAVVAGAANGALAVVLVSITHRGDAHVLQMALLAAVIGAFVALLFVLPLCFVTKSAWAIHARSGSRAWTSQRRRTVRVALACSFVALAPFSPRGFPAWALGALLLALATLAVLEWSELRALSQLDDRRPALTTSGTTTSVLDLGVGDVRWTRASGTTTYRDDAPLDIVWGDLGATRAIVRTSLRDTLATLVVVACAIGLRVLAATFG